jgi:hypothetical protein
MMITIPFGLMLDGEGGVCSWVGASVAILMVSQCKL